MKGKFYFDHYGDDKFKPTQDLKYFEEKEMNDGIYSGFMKPDSKLEFIRFGPGTLVQK